MDRVSAATLALLVPLSLVLHAPSRVSAQPAPPDAVTLWHQSFASTAGRHIAPAWRADADKAPQPLTVRQLYQGVEARLARSGKIYEALVGSTQVWVDARREVARVQSTGHLTSSQPYSYTTIYANGKAYTRGRGVPRAPGQPAVQSTPAMTCEGAHIAASVILGCPNPEQQWTMSLHPGRYAGRQVLVLLRKGTDHSEGNANILTTYTTHIYVDRETLLPLAETFTGTTITKKRVHASVSYVTRLVAPSSLPASFFQPSTLGYGGRADEIRREMKPVPSGFTVLWLGLDFAGGHGLPAMSIQSAVPMGGSISTFSIQLYYASAKNISGSPLLFMEEWSTTAHIRRRPPTGSGWTRQTVELATGHAVILSGHATLAFAYVGSTIALIESPGPARFSVPALQTIVRALRPYVPNS